MANLTDAFGTIIVEKVGKEFLEFIKTVQDKESYYKLIDNYDIKDIKPDSDGNVKFDFGTSGRWAYENNIDGYLNGEWLDGNEDDKKAYDKFIVAVKKKNGLIRIDFKDSDVAMAWMGYGYAELSVGDDGEICYSKDFIEEDFTLENFANQQEETIEWALSYMYGEEVLEKYEEYVEQWHKEHSGVDCEGMEPAGPSEWFTNEYKEEV